MHHSPASLSPHLPTRVLALLSVLAICACESAFSPSEGRVIWSVPAEGWGQPTADANTVYFGTRTHEVIAVGRKSGDVRWRTRTDGVASSTLGGWNVVLAGEVVVFGDDALYGFDRETGALRWFFNPRALSPDPYHPAMGADPGMYAIDTDGIRIYAGSSTGHAYGVNPVDGSPVWITRLAADDNSAVFDPAVASGTVYFTVRHFTNPMTGEVFALDAASGLVKWSRAFTAPPLTSSAPAGHAVPIGDVVVSSNDNGQLYGLDTATGEERWVAARLPDVGAYDDYRPIVRVGDVVVSGSSSPLITGYDGETGEQLWATPVNQGSSINRLGADATTAYILFLNGRLGAYDAKTGDEKWVLQSPAGFDKSFSPTPLGESDAVFVPGISALYALRK